MSMLSPINIILLVATSLSFFLLQLPSSTSAQTAPRYTSWNVPVPSFNVYALNNSALWDAAVAKAKRTVAQMTTAEKVGLTAGPLQPVPRLGIPSFALADGPLGFRDGYGITCFPAGISAAQSWDRELIYQRGLALGNEFFDSGIFIGLAPMMNLARQVNGGRQWEGYGGDPYLSGEAGAMSVRGLQDAGVVTTTKHLIANEQDTFRSYSSSNIDDRTVHEVYGWPFMKAVHAGATAIMCSFNQLNGTYTCSNGPLQNGILRNQWGFRGYVMSDWGASPDAVGAANNGMEMAQPGSTDWSQAQMTGFLSRNPPLVTQTRLNEMVERILTPYYLLEQDTRPPSRVANVSKDHYVLARKIGAESTVLLRNDRNVLPLTVGRKLAVIGSDAFYPSNGVNGFTPDGWPGQFQIGVGTGTLTMGYSSGACRLPYVVAPLDALIERVGRANVVSSREDFNIPKAVELAKDADTALVFAIANSGEWPLTIDGNQADRKNISLWLGGDAMINAVASVNRNTVVVLHVTGQVLMPWVNHPNISGIIMAGLPGQETGNGLADVLMGDVNPCGKLAYTIAEKQEHYIMALLTSPLSVPQINYTEKLELDYRWFDAHNIAPLFEFGKGLSYTNFVYSRLVTTGPTGNQVLVRQLGASGGETEVVQSYSVTLRNAGRRGGKEVVQLYLGFPPAAGEPPRILRGFEKVYVAVNQSVIVNLTLNPVDMAIWDVGQQKWVMVLGTYTVWIGASSRDLKLSTTYDVVTALNPSTTTTVSTTSSPSSSSSSTGNTPSSSSSMTSSTTGSSSVSPATTSSSSSSVTSTTGSDSSKKDQKLWSKVGLAWPDGDVSNMWALAGNGWNRISWLYTYGPWPTTSAGQASLDFVPMMWGCGAVQDWKNAMDAGMFQNASAVLAFHEPDDPLHASSYLQPNAAAELWQQHIQPLHAQGINLGAPAVTHTSRGKTWLQDFMTYCRTCTIDFIPLHWYGSDCVSFQEYVTDMSRSFGNRRIWITEWGCMTSSSTTNGMECNSENVSKLVKCTTSWMGSQEYIIRFSYAGSSLLLGDLPSSNSLLVPNGTVGSTLGLQYVMDLHG